MLDRLNSFEVIKPSVFTVWALISLVTLKLLRIIARVGWTTILPILVFLASFILDLSANTCQTRHVTLTLEVTARVDDADLPDPSVYQVWSS